MSIFNSSSINENVKLRMEDELLICCARTDVNSKIRDKILYLVQNDLDWDYLLNLASRHRLRSLLYHNLNSVCPEMVPEDILSELKGNFNANVRKNLMMTGELIKVLDLLESEGITAVPYKGPVLDYTVYGNIGRRQFSDLDIFIPENYILNAIKLLTSKGYDLKLSNIKKSRYIKTQREYKLINREGILIELHWKLCGIPFSFKESTNCLSKNVGKIKIFNSNILSFNPENLLLILCIHNAGHRWEYLLWICDIAEIIQKYELNWDKIVSTAEYLGIKRILSVNLLLTKFLFDVELKKDVLNIISIDKNAEKISNQIIKENFIETLKIPNLIKCSILHFEMRENPISGLKDVLLHIFAPSINELETVSLPSRLFVLYYIVRPFLLLKSYKLIKKNYTFWNYL